MPGLLAKSRALCQALAATIMVQGSPGRADCAEITGRLKAASASGAACRFVRRALRTSPLLRLRERPFTHASAVQAVTRVQLFAAPWTAARQASLSSTVSDFAQTHVHPRSHNAHKHSRYSIQGGHC